MKYCLIAFTIWSALPFSPKSIAINWNFLDSSLWRYDPTLRYSGFLRNDTIMPSTKPKVNVGLYPNVNIEAQISQQWPTGLIGSEHWSCGQPCVDTDWQTLDKITRFSLPQTHPLASLQTILSSIIRSLLMSLKTNNCFPTSLTAKFLKSSELNALFQTLRDLILICVFKSKLTLNEVFTSKETES